MHLGLWDSERTVTLSHFTLAVPGPVSLDLLGCLSLLALRHRARR